MIRPATTADMADILRLAEKFYIDTSYASIVPFDAISVENLATMLIETGVLLVADDESNVVGMVGLAIAPFMFNSSIKGAYEVVWYVDPAYQAKGIGRDLLKAITPACKEAGCSLVQMVTLASSPAFAGKAYEVDGFEHSETSYTKRL